MFAYISDGGAVPPKTLPVTVPVPVKFCVKASPVTTIAAVPVLEKVVFVQLPEIGGTLAIGAVVGEIESTKSVSDVYAPLSGVVTAVNGLVVDDPSLVNSDPYGNGWFFVLQLDNPSSVPSLLDAAAYRAVTQ